MSLVAPPSPKHTMKLTSFFIPLTVFSIMLVGCNNEPVAEQAATAIPSTITPSTVFTSPLASNPPINTPTATIPSPLTLTPTITFSSPIARIEPTTQLTIPDVYQGISSYTISYPIETWRQETTESPYFPKLGHLTIDGCRINLRGVPGDGTPGAIMIERQLGDIIWSMRNAPQVTPNIFTYVFTSPDLGIGYIIRLETPEEASEEVKASCQTAAEVVLNTFSLVE
jgi:hypothetical protein